MACGCLLLASVMEIVWAIGLKYTEGFTVLDPSILVAIGIFASFALLARASQTWAQPYPWSRAGPRTEGAPRR